MGITREDFGAWKRDKVTKWLFNEIDTIISQTKESMSSPAIIRSANAQLKLVELLGFCEALEQIRNVDIEDTNNESSESTWL